MAGYSGTPLIKKLGIKPADDVLLVNAPVNYFDLVATARGTIRTVTTKSGAADFIHLFAVTTREFEKQLPALKKRMKQDGMIWVSWYKKSAKKETDLTENIIRDFGLALGLVDVKVCAVDEEWSGLKFVIPVADREKKQNKK